MRIWKNLCFLLNPRNTKKIVGYLDKEINANLIPHHINLSHVSAEDYQQMTSIIRGVMEGEYPRLGLDNCDIKEELNKVGLQQLKIPVQNMLLISHSPDPSEHDSFLSFSILCVMVTVWVGGL